MSGIIKIKCPDVATKLKIKAIKEYDNLIKKFEQGYNSDYTNVIDIICFLDLNILNDYLSKLLLNGK